MSLVRYNPARDHNEAAIVRGLKKAGYMVTRISGSGAPDLLVIKPHRNNPVFVVENMQDALECLDSSGGLALLEIKQPGKKLTPAQHDWHCEAMNAPVSGP